MAGGSFGSSTSRRCLTLLLVLLLVVRGRRNEFWGRRIKVNSQFLLVVMRIQWMMII